MEEPVLKAFHLAVSVELSLKLSVRVWRKGRVVDVLLLVLEVEVDLEVDVD